MENTDFTVDGELQSLGNQLLLLQRSFKEYASRLNEKEWANTLKPLALSMIKSYGKEAALSILTDIHRYLECLIRILAYTDEDISFNLLRLQKIEAYVQQHYSQEISQRKIAALVGMTPNALCRFYKSQTGYKLNEYIARYRIEQATRLLAESNDTVSSIGYCCGFNTINYFIKVFRRYMGVTPERWRVENKGRELKQGQRFLTYI